VDTGDALTKTENETKGREGTTRREFNWLAFAWTAFTAFTIAGLAATFRFKVAG
jgi:hypothetical protein